MAEPPLKSLHAPSSLSAVKLAYFEKLSTDDLLDSLMPGRPGSLKVRQDGTVMDGHHRLAVLGGRGVNIDRLPRDIISKDTLNP